MAEAHVHACRVCEPALSEQGPRTGEWHYAVRFFRKGVGSVETYLDGERVKDCSERMVGKEGWMIRLSTPPHECPGHGAPCRYKQEGDVSIVLTEPVEVCKPGEQ